jgi:hypothetical protein
LEEGLPLAGVLVFHRHRQGFTCSNENSEVFGSRQAGAYEVPEEHLKMLGKNRNDNRPELTALRFVDGYPPQFIFPFSILALQIRTSAKMLRLILT